MSKVTPIQRDDQIVAVLGTGAMGSRIARNLVGAGFSVRVWNRTPEKASAIEGATAAPSPADAVSGTQVVLTVLYDAAAVREVIAAAARGLDASVTWADLTTVGVDDIPWFAAFAREHRITFVDAPVQGALPLAEKGDLLVYAAGPERARPALQPVFDAIGRRTDWLSSEEGSTAATATKLVVNGWVFALTTASTEAVALARGLGVDPETFRAAIAGGPLDNEWAQLKSAAAIATDFTPLFPAIAALKDATLICDAAEQAGVQLDLAAAAKARFARTVDLGHGDEDMASTYLASFAPQPAHGDRAKRNHAHSSIKRER